MTTAAYLPTTNRRAARCRSCYARLQPGEAVYRHPAIGRSYILCQVCAADEDIWARTSKIVGEICTACNIPSLYRDPITAAFYRRGPNAEDLAGELLQIVKVQPMNNRWEIYSWVENK